MWCDTLCFYCSWLTALLFLSKQPCNFGEHKTGPDQYAYNLASSNCRSTARPGANLPVLIRLAAEQEQQLKSYQMQSQVQCSSQPALALLYIHETESDSVSMAAIELE